MSKSSNENIVSPTATSAALSQASSGRFWASAVSGFLVASSTLGAGCGDTGVSDVAAPTSATSAAPDSGVDDADRDGVTRAQGDCDDFNNSIYPGAREYGGDGVDSDCDNADGPSMQLVWATPETVAAAAAAGVPLELKVDALAIMDSDGNGSISIEEFEKACAKQAQLMSPGREGVVQFHASCAGTNSCRGMVLQSWGELYEHSCKGANFCAGWSCVETAMDEQRNAAAAYDAGGCGHCHTPSATNEHSGDMHLAGFKVPFQPKYDASYLENFWESRSDDYLRSLIAFGVSYIAPNGFAVSNMPASYKLLNRHEIDTLIVHLRSLQVEGQQFDLPGLPAPSPETSEASDGG